MDRFDELGEELRSSVGGELAADAAEAEHDARLLELRSRTFAEVAAEAMQRGDLVRVGTAAQGFVGAVAYARNDLLTLVNDELEADVNLAGPIYLETLTEAHGAGVDVSAGTGSFRARLSEIEQLDEYVEVVAPTIGMVMIGQVTAVAADHVMLTDADGSTWFCSIAHVAVVLRHR